MFDLLFCITSCVISSPSSLDQLDIQIIIGPLTFWPFGPLALFFCWSEFICVLSLLSKFLNSFQYLPVCLYLQRKQFYVFFSMLFSISCSLLIFLLFLFVFVLLYTYVNMWMNMQLSLSQTHTLFRSFSFSLPPLTLSLSLSFSFSLPLSLSLTIYLSLPLPTFPSGDYWWRKDLHSMRYSRIPRTWISSWQRPQ